MLEPLHERRAKYDTVKARHAAAADADAGGGKRKRNADEPEYQVRTQGLPAGIAGLMASRNIKGS